MEQKISIIYDHYTKACDCLYKSLQKRDKTLLLVLLSVVIFALANYFPDTAESILNQYLGQNHGVDVVIEFSIIGNAVWFLLLIFTIRYYQIVTSIEKEYAYIHQLEDKLNDLLGEDAITKEGKFYLNDYPKYSNWICFLYTVIFPVLLLAFSTKEIIAVWVINGISVNSLLPSLIYLSMVISITLYLIGVHKRKDQI